MFSVRRRHTIRESIPRCRLPRYAFGADINETKILQIADAMVKLGLPGLGYEYVNLDDAWMSPVRTRYADA